MQRERRRKMKPRSRKPRKRQAGGGAARQRPGAWGSPAACNCTSSLSLLTPLSFNLIGGGFLCPASKESRRHGSGPSPPSCSPSPASPTTHSLSKLRLVGVRPGWVGGESRAGKARHSLAGPRGARQRADFGFGQTGWCQRKAWPQPDPGNNARGSLSPRHTR